MYLLVFFGDNSLTEVQFQDDMNISCSEIRNVIMETNLCGETPGMCNESMSDIYFIMNNTVTQMNISVYNITFIL